MSSDKFSIPIIMDIEASGFGADSYPIEIGVVLDTGERYCSLIKPQSDWSHWDLSAEGLHGITREQLHLHGKSPVLVADELNRMLQGRRVFSDGWVVDKRWLIRLYTAAGFWPSFDLSPIEAIQTADQHAIWDHVYQNILQGQDQLRHRASNDAYLVQKTFVLSREALHK
jgi:hypothetical protein